MLRKLKLRDPAIVNRIAEKIREYAPKKKIIKICHVCGTHEWAITHHGLRSLLPRNVEVVAGPGCPVCIVPASEIDGAVHLALSGTVITCFGDLYRVPGSEMSLLDAKAKGADVRVVYSVKDAVEIAAREPTKDFAFFAVGFETTSPSTAAEVMKKPTENLSFLVSHRLIPPAMKLLVEMKGLCLNGFIAPGHVSTIIGLKPYKVFATDYKMPTIITGFEPSDILISILMILKQIDEGKPSLENEYIRAVKPEGNARAQRLLQEAFTVTDGNWRGLGTIDHSRLVLQEEYKDYDATLKYGIKIKNSVDLRKGCKCHLVIIGKIKPTECKLFMTTCNPQKPVGACMVSTEGTCRIWAVDRYSQPSKTNI